MTRSEERWGNTHCSAHAGKHHDTQARCARHAKASIGADKEQMWLHIALDLNDHIAR